LQTKALTHPSASSLRASGIVQRWEWRTTATVLLSLTVSNDRTEYNAVFIRTKPVMEYNHCSVQNSAYISWRVRHISSNQPNLKTSSHFIRTYSFPSPIAKQGSIYCRSELSYHRPQTHALTLWVGIFRKPFNLQRLHSIRQNHPRIHRPTTRPNPAPRPVPARREKRARKGPPTEQHAHSRADKNRRHAEPTRHTPRQPPPDAIPHHSCQRGLWTTRLRRRTSQLFKNSTQSFSRGCGRGGTGDRARAFCRRHWSNTLWYASNPFIGLFGKLSRAF
jgi:hypothetical protein